MIKYKKITLLGLLLSMSSLQAQEESEIIISEENLISLIQSIKSNSINENNSIYYSNENNLFENNLYFDNESDLKIGNNDELMKELSLLKNEVRLLKEMIQIQLNSKNNYTNSSNKKTFETLPIVGNISSQTTTEKVEPKKELVSSHKMDSLYKVISNLSSTLQEKEIIKKNVIDTVSVKVIRNEVNVYNPEVYNALLKKYGSKNEKVYFENNSASLTVNEIKTLQNIHSILVNNPTIDIYIKGFTSNKGSITYNEELALKRAEHVKLYFISKGIAPQRIISNHYGIDYSNEDDIARRVEISYLIRR